MSTPPHGRAADRSPHRPGRRRPPPPGATRKPSRAAATTDVIEAEPPITSDIPVTESFSACTAELRHHVVAGHDQVRVAVPEDDQVHAAGQAGRGGSGGSGKDNPHTRIGQARGLGGVDAAVGHQHVYLSGYADPGEGAPSGLGAVGCDDHTGRPPRHQPVDAGLAFCVMSGRPDLLPRRCRPRRGSPRRARPARALRSPAARSAHRTAAAPLPRSRRS